MTQTDGQVEQAYSQAKEVFAEVGVDVEVAFRLIPGHHRVNLHAMYAETGGQRVERNELDAAHFQRWIEWAQQKQLALDFNPTFFAHPLAANGLTLSHPDNAVRQFWI